MKFINLHGHTSFSYGDGHGTPEAHVLRAKELGMTALAVTEHGNVSSHVQLEKACKKHGIKPIFGCELYVAPPQEKRKFHQTVLAMTQQGYRQLSRLVTRSYDEGFYHKPTVHPEWLLDPKGTSDLIVLSGCADSWLSCTIAGGKSLENEFPRVDTAEQEPSQEKTAEAFQNALALVEDFRHCYEDRYYLELQRFKSYFRSCYINRTIEKIAQTTDIPMVGTADVHYPYPDDWEVQVALNSIAWRVSEQDLLKGRNYAADPCSFPLSDREFAYDLIATGVSESTAVEAIKNTAVVADRCNVELPQSPPIRFSGSDGTEEDAIRILQKEIMNGVQYRCHTSEAFKKDFLSRREEYGKRVMKELEVIVPKGFSDYFLINQEIITFAKEAGIAVGPGRGSAAGSLVCFLLRLTEINPMQFPEMLFERFLDPGREDPPDIDTDYQDSRRAEVFEFARKQYGYENVGNIGNFQRYRGKSAVRDVASARKINRQQAERFASFIGQPDFGDPREFNSAEDAEATFDEARAITEKHPGLRMAYRIEGDMKTLGVHAAGMVLSNTPIYDTCAIYKTAKSNGDDAEVIAFDKRDAAYLNMLKLDCLGLSTMTIIADVIDMVDDLTLEKLYALSFDDPDVLKAFADDDLVGIFQFEGRATRKIVRDIFAGSDRIPDFRVLADINALSRPGSLSSGMTGRYIKVAKGADRTTIHPVVDAILDATNGCLVYQEQVMHIGKQFGGLSDHEIGRLRKIIGAKQAGGAFDAFWQKFLSGAQELHGVSEEQAKEVWDYMAASASYLFNVAHAISYAAIAYWSMYLKVNYPVEFFCASLRSASKKGSKKNEVDPILPVLQDCVKHGYSVSPPTPSLSAETWTVNEDKTGVIAGFGQVKGIGPKLAPALAALPPEERKTWDDLLTVKGFGKKAAERGLAMQSKADPFGIALSRNLVGAVHEAIAYDGLPLTPSTADASSMPLQEGQEHTYIGHVIAIKHIDVIAQTASREGMTHEEVLGTLKNPELATKAKVVCMDSTGVEVHVNVSRYRYPDAVQELAQADFSKAVVIHAVGKISTAYGPAVQANEITIINMEEQ